MDANIAGFFVVVLGVMICYGAIIWAAARRH